MYAYMQGMGYAVLGERETQRVRRAHIWHGCPGHGTTASGSTLPTSISQLEADKLHTHIFQLVDGRVHIA